MRRNLLCRRILLIVLLLGILPSGAFAQGKSWHISDFKDTIVISADGSALVSEKITLVFVGEWHGIHRTIPVEYPGPHNTNYTLLLDVKSVTDEDGHKLKYESRKSGGTRDLKIFIPDAVNATRVVNVDYTVTNATRFFDNYDEFYWNVTGNDWPVPIEHASAFVTLPESAAGGLRAQAFTGSYGSTGHEATSDVKGADVMFETTSPLPMRGGMTIDVYIPQGVLKEPGTLTKFFRLLGSNPIIFLPFLTFGGMFLLWWYKGKDPDPGVSVAPMYEPPKDMSPAEVGTLIDDEVDPRDITSTIVDLAVRGFIKIEEMPPEGLIFKTKDYTLHSLKSPTEWTKIAPHEQVMLNNIFAGGGTATRLSSLKNRFYTAVPTIREDIMSALKRKGMYLIDPQSAIAYAVVAALLILAPFIIVQVLGWKDVFASKSLVIVAGAISALIWWLFARQITAKTVLGGRTKVAILGFQDFMNRVDADRIKRMPPDTFEKYLAYAMALGVEHHWAQAFAGIIKDPPTWYSSPGGPVMFNPIFFSSSMHSLASDMHQVFVSSPRASSSGSGFSGGGGGGFSGGGFGGGGGSAF